MPVGDNETCVLAALLVFSACLFVYIVCMHARLHNGALGFRLLNSFLHMHERDRVYAKPMGSDCFI